jgi:predicted dienelactone hydrolase
MRDRRIRKLLTNVAIVALVSLGAAFVITRQSGAGYSAPSLERNSNSDMSDRNPRGAVIPDLASRAADEAEGYKLETGPLAVTEVSDIVLRDSKPNKDLHVRIFYPVATGKYPVIVFSHGAGGSQNCCDSLTRHWATYGYVTLQPTHDDSATQRRAAGEDNTRFLPAVREALKNPALWQSRPQDISFLLDSLPELQKRVAGLNGKIDFDRIGVGGHSMGSYTAEAIGGAVVDLPEHPGTNFSDPRAKAILCLSPQGPNQFGLTAQSFARISLPFLGITGSLDSLGPVASPAWHRIPFERSQPGDKYEVFIQGASHMSFITDETLLASRSSQAAAILGYTNSASLAFWDAYLKQDPTAQKFLQSDKLESYSHGAVKLSRR